MNQSTTPKVSFLWVLIAALAIVSSTYAVITTGDLTPLQSGAVSLAVAIGLAGLLRSWLWVRDPRGQLSAVWTVEATVLTGAALFLFAQDQTLAAAAAFFALGYQLFFRDYCAGLVRRWEADQQDARQDSFFRQLTQPLTQEPLRMAQLVETAINQATTEMTTMLTRSAQTIETELGKGMGQVQGQFGTALANVAQQFGQKLEGLTGQITESLSKDIDQSVKTWLDGAQEAALAWRRASDTGVRCLSDQVQGLAGQWEQQLALSQAWLQELQKLMVQVRDVSESWEKLSTDTREKEASVATLADRLSQDIARFQTELNRTLTQLTHEQKEWTLGLLNQKRYLQIDQ